MGEKLLQHRHCRNCGKAVNVDDDYCNDKCKEEHHVMLKKKRNQLYLMMVLAVGLMAVTVLVGEV
jgi:predicted nucleic acid-binding Zn ribbon protein